MESGILELYALGELSPEEAIQVEELAAKHKEIADEIAAIELALERYALANAVEPDADVQQRLFSSLNLTVSPGIIEEPEPSVSSAAPATPVVQLETHSGKVRRLQFSLAAAVALLVLSVGALFYTYNELNVARDQIAGLSQQNQQYTRNAGYIQKSNEELKEMLSMSADANWAAVKLAGTAKTPDAKMMLYWNKKSKAVMVNNANLALPKTDKAHQYQLWALVNGKPVDLGVFDAGADTSSMMIRMKEIETAQAFAVTLEPAGGSKNPTLEQMVVMGAVSI
ncbi:anti-sigma factor domain-containing protein [Pedobacter sp. SYP-B3415]|uniref:anti-sigma factor n=1 Tax=Pedobacter sp. SYP-B3415 TaxID=2496641 RepID=UPI0013E9D4F5|nr:anti-sigma factor [Pedobacter sp. SYP-B3415]